MLDDGLEVFDGDKVLDSLDVFDGLEVLDVSD